MSAAWLKSIRGFLKHPAAWGVVVMLAVLVMYLATRSASLDDFDSYSLALALDQFDITLQQPQPPGFPVYIAAARLLDLFLSGPRVVLTTMSALGGALAVGALYWIGWQMTRQRVVALAGAAIFAFSPLQWLAAGKALSDGPGLAVSLLVLAVLWRSRGDHYQRSIRVRWLAAGAGLLGLSLGVRAQTNLPGVVLALWLAWRALRLPEPDHRAARRGLVLAMLVGAAAVLVWLVPVAQDSGGLRDYLDLVNAHSDHVWESDSLLGQGPITSAILRARVKDTLETFLVPTLGVSVYAPLAGTAALQVAALALWLVVGLALADYRRVEQRWLIAWFLLIFVPYFLLESLNRPRLLLPALPPLLLLTLSGWARLAARWSGRTRYVVWLAVGVAALAMLVEGMPLASTLSTEQVPPEQATAYVAAHYPADETLLAVAGSFRAAQVTLPDYRWLYLYEFDPQAAAEAVANGTYRYVAVLDREQFGAEVLDLLSDGGRYVPVDDRLFQRDPRVHWQHAQVRLQVLMPADQIDAAQLVLPPDGRIDLGATEDGRFVGRGWFRAESIASAAARWAGDSLTSDLRVSLETNADYTVTFRVAAYPADQRVTVRVQDQSVAQFEMPADWREFTFTLPGDMVTGEITTLEFAHAVTESPYARTAGGSSDRRELAAAYAWVTFERVAP